MNIKEQISQLLGFPIIWDEAKILKLNENIRYAYIIDVNKNTENQIYVKDFIIAGENFRRKLGYKKIGVDVLVVDERTFNDLTEA